MIQFSLVVVMLALIFIARGFSLLRVSRDQQKGTLADRLSDLEPQV